LTSAPEHSYRNRSSVIFSHHLGRIQRVDICDEAFAPNPLPQ
jgi:hypothetical protein